MDPYTETAEQFIRRFTVVEDAMQNSGETGEYLALTDHCESCTRLASTVRRAFARGGSITYAGTRIVWIHRLGPTLWEYKVDDGPTDLKKSSGARVQHSDGGTAELEISLDQRSAAWVAVWRAKIVGTEKRR